jgi:hypothetical protein
VVIVRAIAAISVLFAFLLIPVSLWFVVFIFKFKSGRIPSHRGVSLLFNSKQMLQ